MLLELVEVNGVLGDCPEPCKKLLLALASDKPVCAIVPPKEDVWDLLIRMSEGCNPKDNPSTDLKLLHEEVPLVFNILKEQDEVPPAIRLLLAELVEKSGSPFVGPEGLPRVPHNLPKIKPGDTGSNGYLPCLAQLVQRGTYVLDDKKTPSGDCAKITRKKTKHGSLIPGIFCVLCPHGKLCIHICTKHVSVR